MVGAWVGFCEFAVEVICNDDSTQMALGVGRLKVVESMSFDGLADGRAVRRIGARLRIQWEIKGQRWSRRRWISVSGRFFAPLLNLGSKFILARIDY